MTNIRSIFRFPANYLSFTVLYNAEFFGGVFVIYLLHVGLTDGEIGFTQLAFFWVNLLFEIPSGVLADRYGRKPVIIVGLFLLCINAIGMVISSDPYLFFALFALQGLGVAFVSGADDSLLYETLKKKGREKEFVKINSTATGCSFISLSAATILGGYLAEQHWGYVYLAYAVCLLLSILFVISIEESHDDHTISDDCTVIESRDIDVTKPQFGLLPIMVLLLAFAFYESSIYTIFIVSQNYFTVTGFSIVQVSWLLGLIELVGAIGFFFAPLITKRVSGNSVLTIGFFTAPIFIFSFVIMPFTATLFFFILLQFFSSICRIVIEELMHSSIDDYRRATFVSSLEFTVGILTGLLFLLLGNTAGFGSIGISVVASWAAGAIALFGVSKILANIRVSNVR